MYYPHIYNFYSKMIESIICKGKKCMEMCSDRKQALTPQSETWHALNSYNSES